MTVQRAHVTMTAIPSSVGVITDFTRRFFELSPYVVENAELSYALQLMVSEAVTNVVRHAYDDEPGEVGVELLFDDERAVLLITDQGKPFDPTRVASPDLDNPLGHGLGVFLIREHADALSYSYVDQTNMFRIEKRLS
ncbi:ATP-binding protein [Desulfovibrio inopinatus]|uniref:ATP-binding protein n=1 Tax=Desulfovibrio inopinatus TaxID=102109 RepID=UPI0003FB0BF2|nr:ATP-binding protein [Desulfovibrio inopinatus]